MSDRSRALLLIFVVALLFMSSFSNATSVNSSEVVTAGLNAVGSAREDLFGKSNVTVLAYQNITFAPINNSVDLGLFSQVEPKALIINVVKGFEPVDRFNSSYTYSFGRESNSANYSLTEADDGLRLFFNTRNNLEPSISLYNMSFVSNVNVSRSDYLSLALSTERGFNSSDGYIGIGLLLRDQQGSRQYVFIHVSNLFSTDAYQLSPYFLGWSYGKEYPQYSFRYRSSSGPWFIQLALNDSLSSLGLSSAQLEGFLLGGELFSIPLPYNSTQIDAKFHYILVHPAPFSINQNTVNSTEILLPPTNYLNISGISCKTANAIVEGPLKPTYEIEEEQENKTVIVSDIFYNISQPLFYNFSQAIVHEARVEGRANITVISKTVRRCTIEINNDTSVDLTEDLLKSARGLVYRFVSNIRSLRVLLTVCRHNAWMYDPAYTNLRFVGTKQGITEEYFVPEKNESFVVIDPNRAGLGEVNIAIGMDNFSSGKVYVNDASMSLSSLIVLDNCVYLAALVKFQEYASTCTIRCSFSSDPIYNSSTVQPFKVFLDDALFEIYTPLNIKAQPTVQIPLTLRISTLKTYTVRVECDPSMLMADNDELMVNKFRSYEYFVLRPVDVGTTAFTLHLTGPTIEYSSVSIPFLVSINYFPFDQVILYAVLLITVLSLGYVIASGNIVDWLLHRNEGNKAIRVSQTRTARNRLASRTKHA
jgi:hypothetical protein